MDVGNDGVGAYDTLVHVGDDGTGVHYIVADVGNGHICVYCKFGLEADNQQRPDERDRTYVEDMEDPVEV